jgi:hypothetical protein
MEQLAIEKFNYLTNQYIELIISLIDYCEEKKILPKKVIFFLDSIKKKLNDNKFEIIQNSLVHILENKDIILNFSLDSLKEDYSEDSDDKLNNLNNIYQLKNLIKNNNQNELEIINLIIEIKKNAKMLLIKDDIIIIKDYIEIMIMILEKIKILFN